MIPSRTRKLRWSGLTLAACLGAAGYGILGSAPSEVAPERSGTTEALMASALRAATHDDCGTDCSHGKPPVNRALFEKYYKFFQPNKDRMVWVNKELGNPEAGQVQVPVAKVVACFAPDTPQEVQAAFLQAMADAGHWPGESGIEYFVGARWSGTQGTPRALTWSFVPDGTTIPSAFSGDPAGPSNLFATLDAQYAAQGGRARWILLFESVFARWGQLTGTSYTRVQNGANPWDSGGAFPGTTGNATTGDVRISMRNIDGGGGILAYNYFPSTGDMVIDASENWGSSTNENRFLRNTLSHEHGHGLAVEHVCSNNSAQLMEPFLNTAFDGPQHDDIRAVQWLYGDAAEPNGTSATASPLGSLATPETRTFGNTPADPTFNMMPIPADGSLFSLNLVGAANDIDFHSLTLTGASSNVTVTAIPVGLTYDNNPQNPTTGACPSGASVNSLALVRLNVELRASNGTTVLASNTAAAAGNNATFTANGIGIGNYFIRVTSPDVLSQTQLYRLQVVTVASAAVNNPPVLGAIGNRTVNELATLSFTATATDPDAGQSQTFSLVGAPAGASINATTGAFSWTPTEAQGPGSFTFTVRVTDNGVPAASDEESITVTVNEVNVAPVLAAIGNRTVNEGTALTFTASATDADLPANTLTYSLVSAPAGATINATTGAFSWTPTEAQGPGSFTFTVRVADNGSPSRNDTESITVTVNEVNVAPVLAAIGNRTVNEGTALTFTASATDADLPANTLTYSLVGAPAGATINATTGAFSWTPTEAQGPGSFMFTVRVADNGTPSLNDTETITVTVNEVNQAPVLAVIGNQTLNEGATLSFTASATDADLPANTLTYSLVGAPAGATINATTGAFSWTPTEAQGPGSFTFTVLVADNGSPSLNDAEIMTVTVNEVNQAPTLASIAPITVNEGQTASFTAVGTDADLPAQTLTYSLVGAPAGASINPSTGAFSWTPSPVQFLQTFTFTVTVTDNGAGNLSASRSVTITTAYTNKVISGNVILESLSIPSNTFTVSLEFTPVGGGTVVTLANIPLGPTGDYSVSTSAIPAGSYDIRAKASHWLAKKNVGVVISASGATDQNFSLKNGDVNGDNEVGAADFSLMAAAYDSVVGDPNYNPDADLNGDGEVGAADFSILAASYDEVGD